MTYDAAPVIDALIQDLTHMLNNANVERLNDLEVYILSISKQP